jgi:hypothetical protein
MDLHTKFQVYTIYFDSPDWSFKLYLGYVRQFRIL